MHFDDMPQFKKPNPLPCGCAIVDVEGINPSGTEIEWRNIRIRFCSMHGAASELLAACKTAVLNYPQGVGGIDLKAELEGGGIVK